LIYHYSLFINIILAFPGDFSNCFNNADTNTVDNKIIILKKVKSIRQLRRTEKELVRLCYKEAIIKGFTLKGIQQYIASKTKIWIEWSCLEYLKKSEGQENKEWYLRLAKDHFAYIGIHREAIDEIQQLKNELWGIIMNSKSENSVKIAAVKELHNLVKTKCLLLRDLPFITRLSKFYDLTLFDNGSSNNNSHPSIFKDDLDNQFNKYAINGSHITDTINSHNNYDDDVMKFMQAQIPKSDSLNEKGQAEMTDEDIDKLISPAHWETIRKLRELQD
jgi:hypothetical protein